MLHRTYRITIDTREQRPLKFPDWLPILRTPLCGDTTTVRITTESGTLMAGDYALQEAPHACGVERKWTLRELAKNCLTDDRHRMRRALEKLADTYAWPVLMVEGSVRSLFADKKIDKPYRAYDALVRLLSEYRISLLHTEGRTARQRLLTGEVVARLLINASQGAPDA